MKDASKICQHMLKHMQTLTQHLYKCKSNNETKKLETFEICRWDGCAYKNDLVFDDPIYISRVEMLLNNGKKRKYLYFQSDYNIKITTGGSEDSDSLD